MRLTQLLVPLLIVAPYVPGKTGSDDARSLSAVKSPTHRPQLQGPYARGIADCKAPIEWDAQSGTNIKWKTRIPSLGHSSPVIWGDRVFVSTCAGGR